MKVTRRHFLKAVGAGAAAAGVTGYRLHAPRSAAAAPATDAQTCFPGGDYAEFYQLPTACPGEALEADEMRITFLGTSCIPRLSQQGVSVYVEVGPTTEDDNGWPVPADYVMFDCGMGVLANYIAAGIPYSRMDKIFLAHLHADHMSEISAIYCFGEANDRKSPLYVWGSAPSGVPDPVTGQIYQDGVRNTMSHLREAWRWHTESFSFGQNSFPTFVPPTQADWNTPEPLVPVGPTYRVNSLGEPMGGNYADPYGGTAPNANYDAYAMVPVELDWQKVGGVAYWNKATGLKITHFPAIHTRRAR
ncbi:MAG: twin-arginine translocation signal domain-containing protein [Anaerolineales bacterium]|nr:twin-arginine translocation signal domain-containing protein [Anaerolineales bacterium]